MVLDGAKELTLPLLRVNDAQSENALVDYMIYVPPTSSACSEIETVPCARSHGMTSISLVRERSQLLRDIFKEREEVVVAEECHKKLRTRQMRTKKAECSVCALKHEARTTICNNEKLQDDVLLGLIDVANREDRHT